MNSAQSIPNKIIANVEKVLLGKSNEVKLAVACFLAEGHLLIDDIPGVGKTTMALALASSVGCRFQRVQFTSDLLPSDLLGVSVFNQKQQGFDFKPGPIFHHVILADEINRASPKTQSALLECMQERQVSMDNQTHPLPRPFFVVATQNPHEHHGTFPLPESQLDRFMMSLSLGYPSAEVEASILKDDAIAAGVSSLQSVSNETEVLGEIERVRGIKVEPALDRYMVEIARATRESPVVDLGLSPRGTLSLRRAAQGMAAVNGRAYVVPDDIKSVAVAVMAHRMRLRGGHFNGNTPQAAETIVHELVAQVPVPR